MDDDDREIFYIKHDLQNGFCSHNCLCQLADSLKNTTSSKVSVDLSAVTFIASNLFSVLGCIFNEYTLRNPDPNSLLITGIKPRIADTIKKNGFHKHLGLEKMPDKYNTVIPYKSFLVDQIDEYERYLTLNLFTRNDLPMMTTAVSDSIRDSLLELFKNVSDHTTSEHVFTCGQYFPLSYMLYFTIVDTGETISYNVNRYHSEHSLTVPDHPLKWALESGNSTSHSQKPRGIGLSLIQDFVELNHGAFYILSDTETFEINKDKHRFKTLAYPFPGTIVTVGFNLHDNALYYLNSGTYDTIQF